MTSARDIAELVRLPAALSVPGDALAGAAVTGTLGWRTAGLAASSTCLYWAGMALNDYADRDLDAVERPERPIPSGRVSPTTALRVAGGLTAAGIGLAAVGGRRGVAVAVPLAATVWAYDMLAKPTAFGPVVMAAARSLDVVLGGSADPRRAVPAALALGAHTCAVTVLSRGEVHGSSTAVARGALATTTAVAAAVAAGGLRRGRAGTLGRLASAALAGTYALTVGRAQAAAAASPDAVTVRRATGTGIRGMVPLQAALVAGGGAVATAVGLMAAGPALRAAAKGISLT
ncbi:SCO3242 family prenyltransferase [Georgenia satyanarayanai]|uniref:SCO3242 family prenyltransferase n=1 Tax=Georgenia satyanarayanai TaxID=860221 RepID=UPI002041BE3F|nr:UbiA family prenyltransferase [Georgenia satyanarayanai]